jgi:hypothetical protein
MAYGDQVNFSSSQVESVDHAIISKRQSEPVRGGQRLIYIPNSTPSRQAAESWCQKHRVRKMEEEKAAAYFSDQTAKCGPALMLFRPIFLTVSGSSLRYDSFP